MYSGITFPNFCTVCGQDMHKKVVYPMCGIIPVTVINATTGAVINTERAETPCPYGLETLAADVEPCLMQSAFQFDNGIRIIIYTGPSGIATYICDKEWKPHSKPYAVWPNYGSHKTATEYHLAIRGLHDKDHFVKEHSTEIKTTNNG